MDQIDSALRSNATISAVNANNVGHISKNETVRDLDIVATIKTELENLKQAIREKDQRLLLLQSTCLRKSERQAELEDSVIAWREKYDRLDQSHKRAQIVNQSLEDKLLNMVDRNTGERALLTSDVATLSVRLAQANVNIATLQREIERYKADMSLAVQLLQCKPESFIPQRISSLPIDVQSKVSAYMRLETNSHSENEGSGVSSAATSKYKILPASESPPPAPCPFPPTAMVHSMRGLDGNNEAISSQHSNYNITNNKNTKSAENKKDSLSNINEKRSFYDRIFQQSQYSENLLSADSDSISPLIMAKFLESELHARELKHCETCQCTDHDLTVLADISRFDKIGTQTATQQSNTVGGLINDPYSNGQLCMRCHSNLNSPSRTNSPYLMKVVKSSDSMISETKSSVSDLNDVDKVYAPPPPKKDNLTVNSILGHHRLCDQTNSNKQSSNYKRPIFNDGGNNALQLCNKKTTPNSAFVGSVLWKGDLPDDEKTPLREEVTMVTQQLNTTPLSEDTVLNAFQKPPLNRPISACSANNINSKQVKKVISCNVESFKMFENFNRNLIRTIKSENSKFRGPRLCAMRIQNTETGQSNILLDKIESFESVQPVIYKRRERLLDEELDDTKNVITSDTSAMLPEDDSFDLLLIANELGSKNDVENEIEKENQNNIDIIDSRATEEKNCDDSKAEKSFGEFILSPTTALMTATDEIELKPSKDGIIESCMNENIKTVDFCDSNSMRGTSSYEAIRSKGLNGKSFKQSNTVDEAADLKESAILRRQQLSRVAEWVQSNTKQFIDQQKQSIETQNEQLTVNCEFSGTELQSSTSTLDKLDSVSIEKLSMDSGYKTTPQAHACTIISANQIDICANDESIKPLNQSLNVKTNVAQTKGSQLIGHFKHENISNNNNTNIESKQSLIKYAAVHNAFQRTKALQQSSHQSVSPELKGNSVTVDDDHVHVGMLLEQPTCDILNYKYYPCKRDKSRAIEAELHMTTTNVDIAQMEYNVKQFLLKQNEWSMRGDGQTSATNSMAAASEAAAATSVIGASQKSSKGFKQSKLYSGIGVGPGIGERMHTPNTEAQSNITNLNAKPFSDFANASISSTNCNRIPASITIQSTSTLRNMIPQRTETNL